MGSPLNKYIFMIRNLIILIVIILLASCSPKLKVYDIYGLMENIKIKKDNYYLKDTHNYYNRLKGHWVWVGGGDSLILKIKPVYKQKFNTNFFDSTNTYQDINKINFKFVKDGDIITDLIDSKNQNNCFRASPMGIYTNMYYVYRYCGEMVVDPTILMFVGNDLVLINKWNEEEGVFLEKDGEYKIVIPRIITLKRIE
jgi:hypothetical protein